MAGAIFAVRKPLVYVTIGARSLGLPGYYHHAATVLYCKVNISDRLPTTISYSVRARPAFYDREHAAYSYKYVNVLDRGIDGS